MWHLAALNYPLVFFFRYIYLKDSNDLNNNYSKNIFHPLLSLRHRIMEYYTSLYSKEVSFTGF